MLIEIANFAISYSKKIDDKYLATFADGSKFGSSGHAAYPEKYMNVRNAIEEYVVVSSNPEDAYQVDMTGWINRK